MSTKITVTCRNCGKELLILPSQLGREVRCRRCHGVTLLVQEHAPRERPPTSPETVPGDISENGVRDAREVSQPLRSRRLNLEESSDLTTMVDVTFLLLIFFMVTAAFAMQRSIEVPPPHDPTEATADRIPEEEEPDAVVVRVLKDHSVVVDERPVPSRQELLAVLRDAIQPQNDAPPVSRMHVFADGRATYETVVMVLDCGNAVGMEEILLKTEDQDQPE